LRALEDNDMYEGRIGSLSLGRGLLWFFSLSLASLLFCLWSVFGKVSGEPQTEPVVHITVFTSPDCPECAYVRSSLVPELEQRYGASLTVSYLNVDEEENYDLLEALERQFGDTDNQFPVLFCGETVLGGRQEVSADLEQAIMDCLQRGGCPPVQLERLPEQEGATGEPVYLAYFHKASCQKCGRVERMLSAFERRQPNLSVRRFDISLPENKKLAEAMGRFCELPEDRRLIAPSLFVGQEALVGDDIREARLRSLIEKYQISGAGPIWELVADDTSQAAGGIIQRFQALGILTIMFAGLIDGINPCAFATIVFLISYLAFVGRQRREVLMAGLAFALAVFSTYLAVGLGFFQFIRRLTFMAVISQVIYGLAAALVFILGVVSLYDYVLIRRGHRPSEMKLQLPLFLKRRIHETIRKQSRSGRLALGAFITGAIVSMLELACTGQVYLPTIVFVTGVSGLRTHAFFYLVLYNLLFILPLALVFLVSYMGVTSQQLGAVMEAHIDWVKLILGFFFFLLGVILMYVLLA